MTFFHVGNNKVNEFKTVRCLFKKRKFDDKFL